MTDDFSFPLRKPQQFARAFSIIAGLLMVASALGQGASKELAGLYARVAKFDQVLSREEGEKIAADLAQIKLEEPKLAPADRAKLLGIRVLTALAKGDAATAMSSIPELQKAAPDARDTHEIVYLAACAAGDAQLGLEALKAIGKVEKTDRSKISKRSRAMSSVGDDAPRVEITLEDGLSVDVAKRRDEVLLVDFWNVLTEPDAKHVKGLRALHDALKESTNAKFVGVNTDAESRLEKAKQFAKDNYDWGQCYEKTSANAPITNEAFKAGQQPWAVLIDSYGYVRAVGAGDEPGFTYALRASVAEAAGEFKPVPPRTKDGKQPGKSVDVAATPQKKEDSGGGDGHYPSNPEAKHKLDQAILYWKTGKRTDAKRIFQEIIDQYPNTQEAETARQYL